MPRRAPSSTVRRRWRLAWLAAALVLCVGAAPAEAPKPGAVPAEKPPEKAAPQPVAIPEIAIRSEQVVSLLRAMVATLDKDPAVDAIARELPRRVDADLALLDETNRLLEQGPRQRVLEAIDDSWKSARTAVEAHNATLTDRASKLEVEIQQLTALRETWRLTAENAARQDAPETVRQSARETIEAIDSTQKMVEQRREVLLELQSRTVRELAVIDGALERVSVYRKEVVGQLLLRDSRPIWHAMSSGHAAGAALTGLVGDAARGERLLRDYLTRYAARFAGLLALFAALVWLFRTARERSRQMSEEEPELAQAALVFKLPYSAALLLTLSSTFWVIPDAPFLLRQMLALIALFPVLRIVRPIVEPALVPGLNAFGAFFVTDRLRDVFSTTPLAEQVLFLVEMLAGVALMAWILWPRRLEGVELNQEQTAALRPLGFASKLLLVSFAFAFVSGALGYMQLARVVGGGVLTCTYLALAFYASLRAADGLLAFALRARPLRLLHFVNTHRDALRRRVHRVLRWSAVAGWVVLTLNMLGLLDGTLRGGRAALEASVSFGTLTISLGSVVAFGVTVVAAFLLSRVLRFLLEEDVYPRVPLGRGVPYAISSLLHYVILFGGFVLAVFAMGVDLTRVTILAGAFGVGIGFGLQNVVNNFVSGLIMLFERPMKLGDNVQVADVSGTVERIGIRSSTLRTAEGAEVVVPNASLISERLTNWTLTNSRRRVDLKLGVAYGTDPQKLIELLLSVARGHREILAYPPPAALFLGFGENSLDFELRCWTDSLEDRVEIRSQLALEVHRQLGDAGIEVPYPQRVLHVRAEKPREERD